MLSEIINKTLENEKYFSNKLFYIKFYMKFSVWQSMWRNKEINQKIKSS